MPRGGARPGAGRKPKDRSNQDFYPDAESYLQAVVEGRTPPDAVRVQAARCLISYQQPTKRAKPKSPTPGALQHVETVLDEKAQRQAFQQKAAKIRAKHAKEKK